MTIHLREKIQYIRENKKTTHFLDSCIKISIISYFSAFLLLGISAFTPQHSIIRTMITALAVFAIICGVLLAGYANCNGIDESSFKEEQEYATQEELDGLQKMIEDYKCEINS